jgi:hypothetical protein
VKSLIGYILPYFGRIITPCDAYGIPSGPDTIEYDLWETKAWVFAWLGFYQMIAYGDVDTRAINPENPRQYMPGDL